MLVKRAGYKRKWLLGMAGTFMTLSLLSNLDSRMHRKTDHFEAYVELPETVSLGMFMDALSTRSITVEDAQPDAHHAYNDGSRSFLIELTTQKRFARAELLEEVSCAAKDAKLPLTGCRII